MEILENEVHFVHQPSLHDCLAFLYCGIWSTKEWQLFPMDVKKPFPSFIFICEELREM